MCFCLHFVFHVCLPHPILCPIPCRSTPVPHVLCTCSHTLLFQLRTLLHLLVLWRTLLGHLTFGPHLPVLDLALHRVWLGMSLGSLGSAEDFTRFSSSAVDVVWLCRCAPRFSLGPCHPLSLSPWAPLHSSLLPGSRHGHHSLRIFRCGSWVFGSGTPRGLTDLTLCPLP